MALKILIPDRITNPDIESKILKGYDILTYNAKNATEIHDRIWNDCIGILAWHDIQYDEELISKLHSCKGIVRVGVGYDNVDLKAAKERNITICNVPDYGTEEVAAYTIGLILLLVRGINKHTKRASNQDFEWHLEDNIHRISKQTLGIIGHGRIGSTLGRIARVLGFKVIFYDPYVYGIGRVDNLNGLLRKSDIVSVNCTLTEETRDMVNLDHVKDDVIIVNTARDGIINEESVYRNIDRIAGIATDVSEYKKHNKIIITPHIAFFSQESFIEMRRKASEELLSILKGGDLRWKVG